MSFLKADILTIVNTRTGRSETDIDNIFIGVLTKLSRDHNLLFVQGTVALADGVKSYAVPTDFKETIAIVVIDSDGNRSKPLTEISFEEYLSLRSNEVDGNNENEPRKYAVHNNLIWPWPVPDQAYTNTEHHYSTYHSVTDFDTITFSQIIQEAVVEGCCYGMYKNFGLADTEGAKTHLSGYREEVRRIKARDTNDKAGPVLYRDV